LAAKEATQCSLNILPLRGLGDESLDRTLDRLGADLLDQAPKQWDAALEALELVTDRVVTVGSQLHRRARLDLDDLNWRSRRYNAMRAYSDSKLANLLFTFELQAQLTEADSAVRAVTAHPGIARTNLAERAGGPWPALDRYVGWLFNDAERGALPIEYAATQDVPGGSYVGPNGLGHLRGYPEIHQPAKGARDSETARRLWRLSASLTGTRETIRVGPESGTGRKAA
jgi:NAD(P)-dependent dehydrogenase (short-subunit alcohol dehydrogenase family)